MGRELIEPTSENPLTTALNLLIVILYAFVLQQLLGAVFTNWHRLEPWLGLLTIAVLLEVLHYAIEDHLYTTALEDGLDANTLSIDILQFLVHFLGVLFLVGAVYTVITGINPSTASLVRNATPQTVVSMTLVFVALQQLSFACWQGLEGIRSLGSSQDRQTDDPVPEHVHWIPRFTAYSVLLLLLAWTVSTPTTIPIAGIGTLDLGLVAVLSLLATVDWAIDTILGSWRSTYGLPESGYPWLAWQTVYRCVLGLAAITLLLDVFVQSSTTTTGVAVLVLFAIKAQYLYQWAGHYHKLLGTEPDPPWSHR